MKKILYGLLIIAVICVALVGCSKSKEQPQQNIFKADDEIFTYEKVDSNKTQLIVSRTGNINVEGLCKEFEMLNPDIQVIYLDITGGNSGYTPLKDWIVNGYTPDVVISAIGFLNDELTLQYFENLSAHPIIQKYEASSLQRVATGNSIYLLPGPSDTSAMMYNKTLFAQYGWQIPTTFDEFVLLCDKIKQDTNGEVEAWNPNAKYSDELTTALQCMTYDEIFAGIDNYTWYQGLFSGESTLTGHMEPYTEVLQTLINHEILKKEHFSYSATTRGKEFAAGKIAMINANIYDADNDDYDFGYMPFPTTQGELGYLCNKYSCYVGLPIKERTQKQNDAAQRFLEYFSSAKGQATYIGNSIKVSNVKGVNLSVSDDLSALQPIIDAGHMFTLVQFQASENTDSKVYPHQIAIDMAINNKSGATCLEELDVGLAQNWEDVPIIPPETIATVKSNMTILDTSFYMADVYRSTTNADIGLIANNEVYRGNVMRMFKGNLTADIVNALKPRSFANNSKLIKVSMTGQQLLDALNNPVGNDLTADCIYAFSGLKCEVAAWNELGKKYVSVKLTDGSELQTTKLYTVAVWAGTIADEYITEIIDTYEGTWEEIMTAKLKTDANVAPINDGRIKLIWD